MGTVLTYRELALQSAITQIGVTEVGFNNRGPKVEEYQAATDAGVKGFAWCEAFVCWNFVRAGAGNIIKSIRNRASVGFFENHARLHGWLVTRPLRGDTFAWRLDADSWPDHTGFVEKVLQLGPVLLIQTVEGNTSSGTGGSQDDGGGVYRRRRAFRASRVTFTRLPGKPFRNPDWYLVALTTRDAWIEWYLGIGAFKGWGRVNPVVRPAVPTKVPRAWWDAMLARRRKEASL